MSEIDPRLSRAIKEPDVIQQQELIRYFVMQRSIESMNEEEKRALKAWAEENEELLKTFYEEEYKEDGETSK